MKEIILFLFFMLLLLLLKRQSPMFSKIRPCNVTAYPIRKCLQKPKPLCVSLGHNFTSFGHGQIINDRNKYQICMLNYRRLKKKGQNIESSFKNIFNI